MVNLTNVSVYNLKNELVSSRCSGTLDQNKTDNSFDTSLRLLIGESARLAIGESYYAVGLTDGDAPVQTETVKCVSADDTSVLEGTIPFPARPQDFRTDDSNSDMLIRYTNYSTATFSRYTYVANLEYGFGSLSNFPGPVLQAGAGQQSIGATQILGWVAEGPADIACTWQAPNGAIFGAWIHFNFQMFRIGPEPVWRVTTDAANWTPSGSDPSFPYTWPASVGFNITGTPTSGHSSLSIDVLIQ